jgi:hypothetical protein
MGESGMLVVHRTAKQFVLLMVVVSASLAFAENPGDVSIETGEIATPVIAGACDINHTKSETIKYDPARAIPDGDTNGTVLGPIAFADDGRRITRVVLELIASHTRVGDLTVKLGYDVTCDGSIDYSSTVICRPRGTAANTPAPCGTGTGTGCGGDLSCGKYYRFGDDGASSLAVGSCPGTVSTGCFKPPAAGGSPLDVFKDLPKDGCWYLTVIDHVTPQKGSVCEWTVYLENHVPVGVEPSSWSGTKNLYR